MQIRLIVFLITCSLLFMAVVWHLINRGQLRPRYALLWLLTSIAFFLLVVFRGISHKIADFFQVSYAPSFYFAVAIIFILLILLNQSLIISTLSRQSKELAQRHALQEWRISELEKLQAQTTGQPVGAATPEVLNYRVDELVPKTWVEEGNESHE